MPSEDDCLCDWLGPLLPRDASRAGAAMKPAAWDQSHFHFLAALIKANRKSTVPDFAYALAAALAQSNPKFKSALFLEACGVEVRP